MWAKQYQFMLKHFSFGHEERSVRQVSARGPGVGDASLASSRGDSQAPARCHLPPGTVARLLWLAG